MMSEGSSDEAGTGTATCLSTVNRNPVIADGRALLVAFSRKQSVKFTDFKETWQEMQFSFVYCSGGDQPRREEIVVCLYVEGLRYLANSKRPDHERLAGLFLVYTVYCTQPVEPKVLVRVTPDDWTSLMELQEVIKEREYSEAEYIVTTMRSLKAFNLTFTSQQKCLCVSSGDHTSEQLYRSFLTGSRSLNPYFLSSLTQDIQRCMDDYCSAKEERRMFFPRHLLNPPQLPQQLNKIVEDYHASVTVKMAKFSDTVAS